MCVNTVTKSAFNETLCAGVEFDCRLLFVLFLSTPKGKSLNRNNDRQNVVSHEGKLFLH